MTRIEPGALIRIGQHCALSADDQQWILHKTSRQDLPLDAKLEKKTRPISFCRTKTALLREIGERGFILTAQGRDIIGGLGDTYQPGKPAETSPQARETADAGAWLDED